MLNNKTPSFGANQRGLAQHQDETVLICLILLNKKEKKIAPTDLKMGYLEGKKKRERDENTAVRILQAYLKTFSKSCSVHLSVPHAWGHSTSSQPREQESLCQGRSC